MLAMLGLFAQIERDLIRMTVNEGVKAAQEKGVKFGRPKGVGKSRLDLHKKEIMHLLENGATRKFIAARHEVSAPALWAWLKKQKG
jgi:DNA invertase Pin-like site-specific DNA recombinase